MPEQQLEPLLVIAGAERGGDQRLGLAAGEERRAVGAREHAHLAGDGPDLVVRPAADAAAAHGELAHVVVLEVLDHRLGVLLDLRGERLAQLAPSAWRCVSFFAVESAS